MLDALSETLPLAAAIAFSPLAIASVVLLLLSHNARAATVGFLVGFAGGVGLVAAITYAVALLLPQGADDRSLSAPFVLLCLGAVAIVLAIRQWRARPTEGDELEIPGWMAKVDGVNPATAIVLGAFFGGAKPKNLLLSIAVGVTLEATEASVGEAAGALTLVVLLGSLPIIVPVVVAFVGGAGVRDRLDRLRAWMIANNAAIVGSVLLLIGVVLIAKGLSSV